MRARQDRNYAIHWSRQILKNEFVVLDTETTGLGPLDEALTIGIVSKSGEILLDARVRPTCSISPRAQATHRITETEAAAFPHFTDCYEALSEILQGKIAVSYCVDDFDRRIIRQTCQANGLPVVQFELEEALYPFAMLYGEWNDYYENYRWQKLSTAAAYFDIKNNDAHSASADALTTLRVIEAMAAIELEDD